MRLYRYRRTLFPTRDSRENPFVLLYFWRKLMALLFDEFCWSEFSLKNYWYRKIDLCCPWLLLLLFYWWFIQLNNWNLIRKKSDRNESQIYQIRYHIIPTPKPLFYKTSSRDRMFSVNHTLSERIEGTIY